MIPISPGCCWTSCSIALGARRRSAGLSDAVFATDANPLSDPSSKRRCVNDWLGADAALPSEPEAPRRSTVWTGP